MRRALLIAGTAALLSAPALAAAPPDLPADARPGQCFALVELPPPTETYQARVLVRPAGEHGPAEWRREEKTRPVGAGRPAWLEAPCARDVTPNLVRRVQRALNGRRYSVGFADGVFGPGTLVALERFQRDRGLAVGALTLESLRELHVQP